MKDWKVENFLNGEEFLRSVPNGKRGVPLKVFY